MRRNLLAGTAVTVALAACGVGANAEQSGWYSLSGAGQAGGANPLSTKADDWAGYAHVGYHLDPHWRVELQGGYRAGQASPAAIGPGGFCDEPTAGPACAPSDKALGAYSVVANLIFDAMPDNRLVDPYFAIGAGASRFDPTTITAVNPAMQFLQANAGGSQLAYQALVGLAFRPRSRLHFDLTYRWLDAMGAMPNGLASLLGGRYQDQTVAITVRYALSSPRAALAPPPSFGLASSGAGGQLGPQAITPHTMVVETPSNPAALAAEAEAAVRQAALSASEGRGSRVVVDGHADTASTADYNRRLSERRAKAMADAMVSLGVPTPGGRRALDRRRGATVGRPPVPRPNRRWRRAKARRRAARAF